MKVNKYSIFILQYSQFLNFVEKVKTDHLPEYMPGVGKMGHGHREYKNLDNGTVNEDFD